MDEVWALAPDRCGRCGRQRSFIGRRLPARLVDFALEAPGEVQAGPTGGLVTKSG
jgi:hypothetical protein